MKVVDGQVNASLILFFFTVDACSYSTVKTFHKQTDISITILLGDSGGVVNSLDFCPASLKSLGCFYFWCVLSSQWEVVTVNFTLPTLKAILEARNHNMSGNKQ